jgi:oxidase EvaA
MVMGIAGGQHKSLGLAAELAFLRSALTLENKFNDIAEVLGWIQKRNREVNVRLNRIRFDEMQNWFIDGSKEKLQHRSGGFFSIEGISVHTNWGEVATWNQPIINQPEIGFLGILVKEFNGILHFLMQAKIEPGNVNNVQLSPTLQATKSNYTQVHRGNAPRYLEYFLNNSRGEVLLDQLQSEQAGRFLKKRNRNIIIRVKEDVDLGEDFRWLTLGQIKELMRIDNVVNMDARTVISGISFGDRFNPNPGVNYHKLLNDSLSDLGTRFLASDLDGESSLHSFDHIIHWFTGLKVRYDLAINGIPLHAVDKWVIEPDCIRHVEDRFFRVIAMQVEIGNREVTSWDQPLIEPVRQGICAFIVKEIEGILHFLVQGKVEPGNFDVLEMAPTVQCVTGPYSGEGSRKGLPYLDFVMNAKSEQIIIDALQSEEGGRFYHEQNRNMILLVDADFPVEAPDNYIWMTLHQLKTFLRFNNYLNIQARNLISTISYR